MTAIGMATTASVSGVAITGISGVAISIASGVAITGINGVAISNAIGVAITVISGVAISIAIGVVITVISGVAIRIASGESINVAIGTGPSIGSHKFMRHRDTSRHQLTMSHDVHLASGCIFRSIFVGKNLQLASQNAASRVDQLMGKSFSDAHTSFQYGVRLETLLGDPFDGNKKQGSNSKFGGMFNVPLTLNQLRTSTTLRQPFDSNNAARQSPGCMQFLTGASK